MAKAAVECGKQEYVRTTMELISNHTNMLEAMGKGDEMAHAFNDPYIDGTLKNLTRSRRKGFGIASSSQNKAKTPRQLPRCGACGRKGHNCNSCPDRRGNNFNDGVINEEIFEDFNGEFDSTNIATVAFFADFLVELRNPCSVYAVISVAFSAVFGARCFGGAVASAYCLELRVVHLVLGTGCLVCFGSF
ncbi:hypothetical protein TSUD_279340 [Trifolium subterraneum]|uniref:CCHC-type domain-containing protein n=1 Tax=Trifolium subterraneum TaxID=3900 RepID=A0A2Z6N4Y0_TRISU|nr:hypothetical protein TSUD_279340 [Trifolium subterraneum]